VSLSEIVVTGYGTQQAGNITGAVTQVSAAEFNTGRIVTPQALIQGKVAGVQVVDNNQPGGALKIRIRGATSVNASSDPLYVIDGMPVTSVLSAGQDTLSRDPFNFINPGDIESITVLKDASAAAIYGANGANGVVLITTKKFRQHGPEIEYTTSLSSSSVIRTPSLLDANQFKAAVAAQAPSRSASLGSANTNWFDLIDHKAFGQQHDLVVSGAGQNSSKTAGDSGGYTPQPVGGSASGRMGLHRARGIVGHVHGDRRGVRAQLSGGRRGAAAMTFEPGCDRNRQDHRPQAGDTGCSLR
jgi:TonB-dependent starch-binding outer membrane protein SusC